MTLTDAETRRAIYTAAAPSLQRSQLLSSLGVERPGLELRITVNLLPSFAITQLYKTRLQSCYILIRKTILQSIFQTRHKSFLAASTAHCLSEAEVSILHGKNQPDVVASHPISRATVADVEEGRQVNDEKSRPRTKNHPGPLEPGESCISEIVRIT